MLFRYCGRSYGSTFLTSPDFVICEDAPGVLDTTCSTSAFPSRPAALTSNNLDELVLSPGHLLYLQVGKYNQGPGALVMVRLHCADFPGGHVRRMAS